MAQAIFSKWFIDFNIPNKNIDLIYNDELKRKVPKEWKICKLTDCVRWESSSQPPKSSFSNEKSNGFIRFIQNRDYETDNHKTYIPIKKTTKICNRYDIMIDKYGDAGKIRCGLAGAYNVALAKITPIIPYTQEYIRQYLSLHSNYLYLHNACMASTRASLNENTLCGLTILLPPSDILSNFEFILKSIINKQFFISDNSAKLRDLKDKLLPMLINGQLQ